MVKNDSHNLDKLSDDAKALLAFAFENLWVGWTPAYMIEVRLDNPRENLFKGGDGLCLHGGGGSRHYAHHYGDDDWAVVHVEDAAWKALDTESLLIRGRALADQREAALLEPTP